MPKRSPVPAGDYGEALKYDPNFRGPVHRRSCTDLLCLLLFVFFLAAWIFVGWFAIANGDVNRILVPTDSNGLKCGLDSGVEDKPYLVFFDLTQCLSPKVPITGCPTPQVCVKSCPKETLLYWQIDKTTPINELRNKIVCKNDVDPNKIRSTPELLELMDDYKCAKHVFKSTPVIGRCLGDLSPLLCRDKDEPVMKTHTNKGETCIRNAEKVKFMARVSSLDVYFGLMIANTASFLLRDSNSTEEIGVMIVEDLVNFKWYIAAALAVVMTVCFVYVALMRWLAAPMVWFSIFGVVGILSYAVYLSYVRYAYLKANPVNLDPSNTNASAFAKSVLSLQETWLVVLIGLAVLLCVILLALIFLRKRIVIAIALIKEGSKAVSSVKTTLIFPIFPWIVQCVIIAAAVTFGLYLYTIGESNFRAVFPNNTAADCHCKYKNGDVCVPEDFNKECGNIKGCMEGVCHFVGIESPAYVNYLFVYLVFGFFWLIFFVEGLGEMILASTFATWYWTFNKRDVPFFTLSRGFTRTVRYHLGTIAFGSLIIAICRMIRVTLEYIDHKLKKYENPVTTAIMCCMRCFFKCLESFLRFINKNAYIMCAVHGKPFFSSAKDAFSLLMRNILRVFVLDKVTDFLFFLSKAVLTVGCGAAAYFAFTSPDLYKTLGERNKIHYDLVPTLIVAAVAYFISSIFFAIYSMAVDTLFLCFLEDCERNDGTPEKPYFMSKQLLKILGKKNKSN